MQQQTVFISALIVYLVNMALNRFLTERTYRLLTQGDKIRLLDSSSSHRSLGTYLPLGLVLASFVVGNFNNAWEAPLLGTGLLLAIAAGIVIQFSLIQKLRSLNISPEFIRQFGLQIIVVQILPGIAVCLIVYSVFAGDA